MSKFTKIIPLIIFWSLSFIAFSMERAYIRNEESKHLYLEEIREAKQYVIVGTFKLHKGQLPDAEILNAIKQACINLAATEGEKNKLVRVFLESRLRPDEIINSENLSPRSSLEAFQETGANIIKDVKFYDNLHFKVLLTERMAIIGTTNFDVERPGVVIRDFCVFIKNLAILNEIKGVLEKVEAGEPFECAQYSVSELKPEETRLTWGPQQHRHHFIELIQLAKSIDIYQQSLQDATIFEALKKRLESREGREDFRLRILMSEYPFGKGKENKNLTHLKELAKAGAQVRLTGRKKYHNNLPLHIHAKAMLINLNDKNANTQLMYLGSANFYGPVLNPEAKDFNVGIITRAPSYIDLVQKTFEEDWGLHEGEDLATF